MLVAKGKIIESGKGVRHFIQQDSQFTVCGKRVTGNWRNVPTHLWREEKDCSNCLRYVIAHVREFLEQ